MWAYAVGSEIFGPRPRLRAGKRKSYKSYPLRNFVTLQNLVVVGHVMWVLCWRPQKSGRALAPNPGIGGHGWAMKTFSHADFDRSSLNGTSTYVWKSAGKYGSFASRLSRSLKIIEYNRSIGHVPLIHSNHRPISVRDKRPLRSKNANCLHASI